MMLRLRSRREERGVPISFDQYLEMVNFQSNQYWFTAQNSRLRTPQIDVDSSLPAYVSQVYKQSGVVAAAIYARQLLLSQLDFRWKSLDPAQNGKLFGTQDLALLEEPGNGMTRAELLMTAEAHVSLAGNAFFYRSGGALRLLRPDWVNVAMGSNRRPENPAEATDATLLGYMYTPPDEDPQFLDVGEVAHWKPEPDPVCWWRGESWVTSVLSQIGTDRQASTFKAKFFENSATPQLVVSVDATATQQQVDSLAESIAARHEGADKAFKTLILAGGATANVVGSNLSDLSLRDIQGQDETRIASRSRVPAVVLGISEGMQGSALNSGNYSQTRRLWSDGWFTPTANNLCDCLSRLVRKPAGGPVRLSYDPALIMFLQEDRKDEAEIMSANAAAIRQLVDAGYDAESCREAVQTNDLSKLKHSGLFSVQLQPPGTTSTPDPGKAITPSEG